MANSGDGPWTRKWDLLEEKPRRGGQSLVRKVKNFETGGIGALKELELESDNDERRARLAREVFALKTLNVSGVPKILDDNTAHYKERETRLYVVMEWIEGPRLQDVVSGGPLGLDEAIPAAVCLASILQKCHSAGIVHRDVKPDNVILRNGKLSDLVLVDFGLARQQDSEVTVDFGTSQGEDMGSRFLRLPEAAPGMHAMDERSDITSLVGVLFYMITGVAPRQLEDSKGSAPHEALADKIPSAVRNDKRWPRLSRVFRTAFQIPIHQRFQTLEQLEVSLRMVTEDQASGSNDAAMKDESDKLAELMSSSRIVQRDKIRKSMVGAHRKFIEQFVLPSGVVMGGSGPNSSDFGRKVETHFYIHREGNPDIQAKFTIITITDGSNISASFGVEGGALEQYYEGLVADNESLLEATETAGKKCCARVLHLFRNRLVVEDEFHAHGLADIFGDKEAP